MYKSISRALLLIIFSAAVIFALSKIQPAEDESAEAYAAPAKTEAQTAPPQSEKADAAAAAGTTSPAKQTAEENKPAAASKPAEDKAVKPLKEIFKDKGIDPSKAVIGISVDKSEHTLSITAGGRIMKTYHVELGEGGQDDKEVSGDHKTPEGSFYVTERSVLSPVDYYLGSRWMELSYPNKEDAERGLNEGIISKKTYDSIVSAINSGVMPPQDTALGGGVGIHGGDRDSFGSNWTWGCVGLSNTDVEDFYSYIKVGTKVIISR